MPSYRIHRLREAQKQQFRWAPHTNGATEVKVRDYLDGGEVEAAGEYAAWAALQGSDRALAVGDLLEKNDGRLFICKYVGFEEARWVMPEVPSS
jgi:hypothetical protein